MDVGIFQNDPDLILCYLIIIKKMRRQGMSWCVTSHPATNFIWVGY